MKAILLGAYALLLLVVLISTVSVHCKRNKFDFDALEKEWEKGDSEEELDNEYNKRQRVTEKLIKGSIPEMPHMNFDDPSEVLKQLNKHETKAAKMAKKTGVNPNHATGAMMFVELDMPRNAHLKDKKARDKLASQWRDMMHNAAISADIYNIGDDKFLFKVDKGWLVKDVLKFAATRPEVDFVSLDSKKFYGSGFDDEL